MSLLLRQRGAGEEDEERRRENVPVADGLSRNVK